jgi:hypothetical protein
MIHVGVRIGAVVGIALLACVGAQALAALPDPLADGLRHCAGESDQAKRLACFDALAAGLPKVEADQFGLTADIARKRQPQAKSQSPATATAGTVAGSTAAGGASPTKVEPKPAGQALPGKITAIRQASGGVLVFTLDNNQVWVQADADTRFSFNVGEDVRIEHGAMGSFWLAANKGRKTKVKRIS